MEYRIRKEVRNNKTFYRAEVNHKTLYGVDYWVEIVADNENLSGASKLYKSIEDAEYDIECHHREKYANTKDDESSVVKKFNL